MMVRDVPRAGGNVLVKSKVRGSTDRLALPVGSRSEFSSGQDFMLPGCGIGVS